jgi:hypothetical protein
MGQPGNRSIETQAKMFASFEYLREILDSCAHVAVVLNEQRQIVFFNRALYELTGRLDDSRLIGARWGEALNCVWAVENDGCGISEACHTCGAFLAIGEALGGMYGNRECRFTRTVDGMSEWLDLSVGVSPAFVGGERFLVCSVRDISNEKRKAVLERIFFHDVLNSATGVEILSSMLQVMVQGEASLFAQQIRACAVQLVEEIESQQQLVAAEKEELAVKPVTLNTFALIGSVAQTYRLHVAGASRIVQVVPENQDVTIYTDDAILRRVLANMLKNALEASTAGETVKIGCRDAGQEVEFWTNNPGVMGEDVQLSVFQRSFSTKGGGRGLGTYSMKLLSERYLKGSVTFSSTASEGTTFIARYPKSLR